MKKVLFLCTSNYDHSRFAELLFNAVAIEQGLDWQASSRGLATERGTHPIGSISPKVVKALVVCQDSFEGLGTDNFGFWIKDFGFRLSSLLRRWILENCPIPHFKIDRPLAARNISVPEEERSRFPLQVRPVNFRVVNQIIALDKTEHLPLIEQKFPLWTDTVEYWSVKGMDESGSGDPQPALKQIEQHIKQLMERAA